MAEHVSFGAWLKQRRSALDLTQAELAQRLGCATVTLQKIELDERRPSKELAAALAAHLGVPDAERAAFVQTARGDRAPDRLAVAAPPAAPPPWQAAPRPTQNLPLQLTSFVGRERDVAAVRQALRDPSIRLLTLTGPGGTGKTRLALQAAADLLDAFPDGVWFVDLAPIRDPSLVLATIAQTLGVTRAGERPLLEVLTAYLMDRQLLLVLDNCEQVLEEAPVVAALLRAAPQLTVLATSRASLHLSGEHEYAVPPLAVPPHAQPGAARASPAALVQYAAVTLFVARGQAVTPDFHLTEANAPAVAEICARLDGLPLAIELAAARCKLFAPPALLGRLAHRLQLLTGGARDLPERQQTIRATIDWSYQLLSAAEQQLFTRLAVFVGGWTVEAAEAVCNAVGDLGVEVLDGLAALVDQHLVRQEVGVDGEPRFRRLETIREYAQELLETSGEAEALRQQHAAYFVALAERAEPRLRGHDQLMWLDRLDAEHDNLRAALAWSQAGPGETPELSLRFVAALGQFWLIRGHYDEWRRWHEGALAAARPDAARAGGHDAATAGPDLGAGSTPALDHLIAKAILWRAFLLVRHGWDPDAAGVGAESLARYQALGDPWGIAASLLVLGHGEVARGEVAQGQLHLERSLILARQAGDPWLIAWGMFQLGFTANRIGAPSRQVLEDGLVTARQSGDRWVIAELLTGVGFGLEGGILDERDLPRARALFDEALRLRRELGDRGGMAQAALGLAWIALEQGDYATAHAHASELHRLEQAIGNLGGLAMAQRLFAAIALAQDDVAEGRARLEEFLVRLRELHDRRVRDDSRAIPFALCTLGMVVLDEGDVGRAAALFAESLPSFLEYREMAGLVAYLNGQGAVSGRRGQAARAARLFGAAAKQCEEHGITLESALHLLYERAIERPRALLDTADFAAAWAEGQAMTLEQAVAYALDASEDDVTAN